MYTESGLPEFTEHIETARHFLDSQPDYATPPDVQFKALIDHSPHVIVTHVFDYGPGEADQIVVIGLYVPHDGQCTTVVNHVNGCVTFDNADDMFPKG